jgi:hypothetical protein
MLVGYYPTMLVEKYHLVRSYNMKYKLSKSPASGKINSVTRIEDTFIVSIPFDPANTDYQAYLKWLEEGNTPLPAENN